MLRRTTLALCLLPLPALADEGDRGYLTAFLEDNLSSAGRQVTITGFEGALSSQARMTELTLADDSGVWLTLRDVVLDWNRGALLSGKIAINELSAAEIIMARPPRSADTGIPAPEASSFALPDIPVSLAINHLPPLPLRRPLRLPMKLTGNRLRMRRHGMRTWRRQITSLLPHRSWHSMMTTISDTSRPLINPISLRSLNRTQHHPTHLPLPPLGLRKLPPTLLHLGAQEYHPSHHPLALQPGPNAHGEFPTGSRTIIFSPQLPKKRTFPKHSPIVPQEALTWTLPYKMKCV